jgi:hypothetical protein
MFVGQPFDVVAEHLKARDFSKKTITTVSDMQQAIFNYWSERFNGLDNLEPGASSDNQKAGRLIGVLRKRFEMSEAEFEPFLLDMKAFGIQDSDNSNGKMMVDSWGMLVDIYYNANNDFNLNEKDNVAGELFQAAGDFHFSMMQKK